MKSRYVLCILLGLTIGSAILADYGGVIQAAATGSAVVNEAQKSAVSTISPTVLSHNITVNDTQKNDTTTAVPITSTTISTLKPTTANSTTTTSSTTTAAPTTKASTTTTTTTTTAKPTTTTIKTTSIPSTSAVPSTSAPIKTTAVPPSPPSASTDRHFDGLSFFGGIILATCLMAIAAFSWKFYRTCNEGNYRTL